MPGDIQYNFKKLIVVICLLIVTTISCRFYFNTTKDSFDAKSSTVSVERGKNLTHNVCGGCHYDHAIKKFIGRPLNDLPKIAGKLYSANLTRSVTHGITQQYSDAELFYLLKTGIARKGEFMPYMMKSMLADEDINDIIIYLRSNDPDVGAVDTTIGISHINFIGKAGIRIASKPQPYSKGIVRPDENDAVAYGGYLVAITGCYHCHSKKVLGLDYAHPEASKGYMQGGMKLKNEKGKKVFGPNLTPDSDTGIGNFTADDFTKAVRDGITPGGKTLHPPMPKFKHLTNKQVNAIYAYIHSLPPVHHKVKGS